MVFCHQCGKEIDQTVLYCPSCGTAQIFYKKKISIIAKKEINSLKSIINFLIYFIFTYLLLYLLFISFEILYIIFSNESEDFNAIFEKNIIQAKILILIITPLFFSTRNIDLKTPRIVPDSLELKKINEHIGLINLLYTNFLQKINYIKIHPFSFISRRTLFYFFVFSAFLRMLNIFYATDLIVLSAEISQKGLLPALLFYIDPWYFDILFVASTGLLFLLTKKSQSRIIKPTIDHELTFTIAGEKINILHLQIFIILSLIFLQYESPYIFLSTPKILFIFFALSTIGITTSFILKKLNYILVSQISLLICSIYLILTFTYFNSSDYNIFRLDFFHPEIIHNFDSFRILKELDTDKNFPLQFFRQYINILFITSFIPYFCKIKIDHLQYGSIKGDYIINISGIDYILCLSSSLYTLCFFKGFSIILYTFIPEFIFLIENHIN